MDNTTSSSQLSEELLALFQQSEDCYFRIGAIGEIRDFHAGSDKGHAGSDKGHAGSDRGHTGSSGRTVGGSESCPFDAKTIVLGQPLSDLLPLGGEQRLKEILKSVLGGEVVTVECRLAKPLEGRIVEARFFLHREYHLLVMVRDITRARRSEETLEVLVRGTAQYTGYRFFESLVHLLSTSLDVKYAFVGKLMPSAPARIKTIAYCNQGKPEEAIEYDLGGTPCEKVLGDRLHTFQGRLWEQFPEDPFLRRMHIRCCIGAPIFSSTGDPLGILSVMSDSEPKQWILDEPIMTIFAARCGAEMERLQAIEDLHLQQIELAHAGRLATVGELCGGVVHEVRQPLYSISNFAIACKNRLKQRGADGDPEWGGEILGWLEAISKAASSAQDIIGQLHGFLQRQDFSRSSVDLNEIVRDVLAMMDFEIRKHHIAVDCELAAEIEVVGSRVQLQQVLVNLIHNAIEELELVELPQRHLAIESFIQGDQAEVTLRDSGPGMTANTASHLFDPFFSLKKAGLGLGMTISKTIIEAHGGKVWFEPADPGGTIFHFTLPLQ